jgi:hypothetical protein
VFVPAYGDWNQDQNEPYLDLFDDRGLITIRSGGAVSMPMRFPHGANSRSATKEYVLDRVRSLAATEAH